VNVIEVQNLRRVYMTTIGVVRRVAKEVVAVEDISFEVHAGELFGLLGPNGAGKTTTVKMLTTLLIPSGGRASVLGHDVVEGADALRGKIGFIFGGDRGLYWRLSAIDNLRYFASLYHMDPDETRRRIPYLLELVGLTGRGEEKVEGYSRGMKQRLHIARTLLHDPPVLFLDEPTIGLDVTMQRRVREFIREHNRRSGATVLLTSHYMADVEALCPRVIVIDKGHILFDGAREALVEQFSTHKTIALELGDAGADLGSYAEVVRREGARVTLRVPRADAPKLTARLLAELPVLDLSVENPSIEDVIERVFREERS
jgi:ABC-2 type transport system ATP-binding protein